MQHKNPLTTPGYYHTASRGTATMQGVTRAIQTSTAGEAVTGIPAERLAEYTVAELRAEAKRLKVAGYSRMKRPALEAALGGSDASE